MNARPKADRGTGFGKQRTRSSGCRAGAWSAGAIVLLALILAFDGQTAAAAPGDYQVEAFAVESESYAGPPEVFTLNPNESQQWARFSTSGLPIISLKVGKKVGVLLLRNELAPPKSCPEYMMVTEDQPFVPMFFHRVQYVMIFNKGANKGILPNGKVKWERPRPDGVLVSRHNSNTLVGGSALSSPETPHFFIAPFHQNPPPYNKPSDATSPLRHNAKEFDCHWIQIWGKTTYLKIRDKAGHEKTYTTDGKAEVEFDLGGSNIFQNLQSAEVGTLGSGSTGSGVGYDPATARAQWEFQNIRFKQFAKAAWIEFQSEKPTFRFVEVERKPDFVELLDKDRNIRVKLYADRITMLNPGYNPQYTPLYVGGGWRDYRDFWWTPSNPGHYFKKAQGNSWNEYQNGKKIFSFTESQRTPEAVELMDASRHLWVRRGAGLASIRKEDPAAAWQPLGPGEWEFDDAPEPTQKSGSPGTPGPPPAILVAADVAGTWVSNAGVEYQLQQSGLSFTWSAPQLGQSGQGNLYADHKVDTTWSGPTGSGSTTGQITHFDAAGKPSRIQWNNGVVITRKTAATPAQPGTLNLQGNWVNNFGIVYHIKQTGMTFTWVAPKRNNESAQGNVLPGNAVNVKWSGPLGSGYAGGKITQFDAQGKPTRIEWSNGAVFTRQ